MAEAQGTIYVVGRPAVSYASTQSGLDERGWKERAERKKSGRHGLRASKQWETEPRTARFAGRRLGYGK